MCYVHHLGQKVGELLVLLIHVHVCVCARTRVSFYTFCMTGKLCNLHNSAGVNWAS